MIKQRRDRETYKAIAKGIGVAAITDSLAKKTAQT